MFLLKGNAKCSTNVVPSGEQVGRHMRGLPPASRQRARVPSPFFILPWAGPNSSQRFQRNWFRSPWCAPASRAVARGSRGSLFGRRGPERVATESLPLWQWSSLTRSGLTCPYTVNASRSAAVLFVDLLTLFTTRAPLEALVLLRLRCWKQAPAVDFQEGQEPFFAPSVNAWMPWRRRRKSHAVGDPQRRKRLEKATAGVPPRGSRIVVLNRKGTPGRGSLRVGAASDCVVTSPQCVFDAKTTCGRWSTSCSAAHPSDRSKEQLVALKLQLVATLQGIIE